MNGIEVGISAVRMSIQDWRMKDENLLQVKFLIFYEKIPILS